METQKLVWPDSPTCHLGNDLAERINTATTFAYRQKQPHGRDELDGYGYDFRTCGFCGSIAPEDLFYMMTGQYNDDEHGLVVTDLYKELKLGGSDWKYGWPHKFYIEGIPNPKVGEQVSMSSMHCSGTREEAEKKAGEAYPNKPFKLIEVKKIEKELRDGVEVASNERELFDIKWLEAAPKFTHAKFYSEHIKDIVDEHTREIFCKVLAGKCGVEFRTLPDGRMQYSAPYAGYQK